jgi:hypothetical protein
MSNNKQSSVVWYSVKRDVLEIEVRLGKISSNEYAEELAKAEQQAKAMHKSEIITAYSTGLPIEDGVFTAIDKAHKYHNETFNND